MLPRMSKIFYSDTNYKGCLTTNGTLRLILHEVGVEQE